MRLVLQQVSRQVTAVLNQRVSEAAPEAPDLSRCLLLCSIPVAPGYEGSQSSQSVECSRPVVGSTNLVAVL
jgi:hypothetical protein